MVAKMCHYNLPRLGADCQRGGFGAGRRGEALLCKADREPLVGYVDWANARLVRRHPVARKIYRRLPVVIERLLARALIRWARL